MITLILLALVLTLIQLMTPAFLNSKNLEFLISNREGSVEEAPIVGRTRRAGSNILETLPAFLALAILSMMLEVENYNLAMFWICLLYTSPSPRDATLSRMPSSA